MSGKNVDIVWLKIQNTRTAQKRKQAKKRQALLGEEVDKSSFPPSYFSCA